MAPRRREVGRNWQLVIVGGGLAGLATAASCARRGIGPILLIEQESRPGSHSSGRNSGLIRRVAENPLTTRLCIEGADEIEALWNSRRENSPFRRSGSVIFDPSGEIADGCWSQVPFRRWDEAQFRSMFPEFKQLPPGEARFVESDGILEVPALLGLFAAQARDAGVELRMGSHAHHPRIEGGRFNSIHIDGVEVKSAALVVASGAWAGQWSQAAGVPIEMTPYLRSCVHSDPIGHPPRLRPWIWAHDPGWYLKFGIDNTLWSACEEIADQPGRATVCGDPWQRVKERVGPSIDAIEALKPRHIWAGHRNFCRDRQFLLGPDPRIEGWHWAVGLGGHGVTASPAVGRRVAAGIIEGLDGLEPELCWSEERFPMNRVGTT